MFQRCFEIYYQQGFRIDFEGNVKIWKQIKWIIFDMEIVIFFFITFSNVAFVADDVEENCYWMIYGNVLATPFQSVISLLRNVFLCKSFKHIYWEKLWKFWSQIAPPTSGVLGKTRSVKGKRFVVFAFSPRHLNYRTPDDNCSRKFMHALYLNLTQWKS